MKYKWIFQFNVEAIIKDEPNKMPIFWYSNKELEKGLSKVKDVLNEFMKKYNGKLIKFEYEPIFYYTVKSEYELPKTEEEIERTQITEKELIKKFPNYKKLKLKDRLDNLKNCGKLK